MYWPPEILMQILSRLPVKTLIRFRCLSKLCRNLIDLRSFNAISVKNATIKKKGFILHKPGYLSYCDQNLVERQKLKPIILSQGIVGSCNGLLCVVLLGEIICLCNPSIRTYKIVDPPCFYGLDADVDYGFGFCPQSNDYKLVRIQPSCGAEVYSLSTDSWRWVNATVPCRISQSSRPWQGRSCSCVYVDGVIYWLGYVNGDDVSNQCVMSFDLFAEAFGIISLPPCWRVVGENLDVVLGVLRESLCLVTFSSFGWEGGCSLWVMEKHGAAESNWVKEMSFEQNILGTPLCIGFNDELITSSASEYDDDDGDGVEVVALCDISRQLIKVVGLMRGDPTGGEHEIVNYVESVALMDGAKMASHGHKPKEKPCMFFIGP